MRRSLCYVTQSLRHRPLLVARCKNSPSRTEEPSRAPRCISTLRNTPGCDKTAEQAVLRADSLLASRHRKHAILYRRPGRRATQRASTIISCPYRQAIEANVGQRLLRRRCSRHDGCSVVSSLGELIGAAAGRRRPWVRRVGEGAPVNPAAASAAGTRGMGLVQVRHVPVDR